ncbi:hypothetical protein BKA67DRAFT_227812 [Truncatella angustata]|uniref:Uncharacterized protein n=1 Tax=Truncatella angustata TaxID=152316 RepID=A0A9P8ZXQ1_9PEZI|nr:uncharacterized protein BKA67DRAFT_227812 [Truncatella angustata]KAH6655161.1 hypothetical protein BKA67DRAFT_227812 [Truncatella angustata]
MSWNVLGACNILLLVAAGFKFVFPHDLSKLSNLFNTTATANHIISIYAPSQGRCHLSQWCSGYPRKPKNIIIISWRSRPPSAALLFAGCKFEMGKSFFACGLFAILTVFLLLCDAEQTSS